MRVALCTAHTQTYSRSQTRRDIPRQILTRSTHDAQHAHSNSPALQIHDWSEHSVLRRHRGQRGTRHRPVGRAARAQRSLPPVRCPYRTHASLNLLSLSTHTDALNLHAATRLRASPTTRSPSRSPKCQTPPVPSATVTASSPMPSTHRGWRRRRWFRAWRWAPLTSRPWPP